MFTESLNRSNFFLLIELISIFVTGLNIPPRDLAILCQKVGVYAVLWSMLISLYILSLAFIDVITTFLLQFLLGGKSHCGSSVRCHGPDGFSMWWSQQTSCYDLSGVHLYQLWKSIFSYSLHNIMILLVIDAACGDCWPCWNSQPYTCLGNWFWNKTQVSGLSLFAKLPAYIFFCFEAISFGFM